MAPDESVHMDEMGKRVRPWRIARVSNVRWREEANLLTQGRLLALRLDLDRLALLRAAALLLGRSAGLLGRAALLGRAVLARLVALVALVALVGTLLRAAALAGSAVAEERKSTGDDTVFEAGDLELGHLSGTLCQRCEA